jgi:hypothetical protein
MALSAALSDRFALTAVEADAAAALEASEYRHLPAERLAANRQVLDSLVESLDARQRGSGRRWAAAVCGAAGDGRYALAGWIRRFDWNPEIGVQDHGVPSQAGMVGVGAGSDSTRQSSPVMEPLAGVVDEGSRSHVVPPDPPLGGHAVEDMRTEDGGGILDFGTEPEILTFDMDPSSGPASGIDRSDRVPGTAKPLDFSALTEGVLGDEVDLDDDMMDFPPPGFAG